MSKEHVYCVGFYMIPYIRVHIWSWHIANARQSWRIANARKKPYHVLNFYVQDWRWMGSISNSYLCDLVL
jgi:hypothetical protein